MPPVKKQYIESLKSLIKEYQGKAQATDNAKEVVWNSEAVTALQKALKLAESIL